LDVFDRSNDATELHDAPQKSRPAPIKSCGCKCYVTSGRFAISGPKTYFIGHMFKAFESCIPTKSTIVPHGQDWLHEVNTTARRVIQKRPSVPGAHSCFA
jgi:hypothetical protein